MNESYHNDELLLNRDLKDCRLPAILRYLFVLFDEERLLHVSVHNVQCQLIKVSSRQPSHTLA